MANVRDIGSRLELFVDRDLIDTMTDTVLRMHAPRDAGVALQFDEPWEGLFAGCITVLEDAGKVHMYYRGFPESRADDSEIQCTCYAVSDDGITFTKPSLGVREWMGRTDHNVILGGDAVFSHNMSPFIDTKPGVPSEQRFKAIAGLHPLGLFASTSADGVHWRTLQDEPIITSEAFAFDSQNVAFWSEHEQCYACYFRTWREVGGTNWRWISRSTSDDFVNWTDPVQMSIGDETPEQLYTQQTLPYFRAPHLYIALAARFQPGKQVLTDEQIAQTGAHEQYTHDCSDAVLLTSRGGARYDRTFMESFLRPGPGYNHWVSRTNYPARGIVQTGPNEMSIYAHRHYAQPTAHAGRFTLRLDGFASVNALYTGGAMLTKLLRFEGRHLVLNYATSAAGEIRVELRDEADRAIERFTADDCDPIVGDEIERPVTWGGVADVGRLAGRPVRLCFLMRDADLFSLRFGN